MQPAKQSPKVLNAEELKVKWTAFSDKYTNIMESNTLVAAKHFCQKFLSLRQQLKLPESGLSLGEIACGSGQFAEHFLESNPGVATRVSLFDLTEAMVQKASQRLAKLSQTLDLSVRMESNARPLGVRSQPNSRRRAARGEVGHQRDTASEGRRGPPRSARRRL